VDFFDSMTEEDARVLWIYGGHGTPEDFPGTRVAIVRMLRARTAAGLRSLGKFFASLSPRAGAVALAALLRVLISRPAGVPLPARAPVHLSPQGRCYRLTPARAP
jgi:hypothetical protein